MDIRNIDKSELVKWIVVTVISIILIVFLLKFTRFISGLFSSSLDDKKAKEMAQNTPDTELKTTGGQVDDSFNPRFYGDNLFKVNREYHIWMVDLKERCEVYKQVTNLNDNELILVSNYYKNNYSRLLRHDLKDVTFTSCSHWITGYFKDSWHTQLSGRLDKLES